MGFGQLPVLASKHLKNRPQLVEWEFWEERFQESQNEVWLDPSASESPQVVEFKFVFGPDRILSNRNRPSVRPPLLNHAGKRTRINV
jgi:hypothetical protein